MRESAAIERKTPRRFQGVWLVPIIAAAIAGYLGWRAWSQKGPEITITFATADGLVAGQTQLKYKAVSLGTVTQVKLSEDRKTVIVTAQMTDEAEEILTDRARFWVVRPRFAGGGISGVETLVSGAYIQCDPGAEGGEDKRHFAGLGDPPGIRSDEPGTTFVLKAEKTGTLAAGSPIYYRDVNVGEVLGTDIGDGFGAITLNAFIRAPYDRFVRPGTRFWNASGLTVKVGAGGIRVQLQSLQAVLAGGINFVTPPDVRDKEPAKPGANFTLYASQEDADSAMTQLRVPMVSDFEVATKSLGIGSNVTMFGIRIGKVTDVKLLVDPKKASARVRVKYEIEPERAFSYLNGAEAPDPFDLMRRMAKNGLRAKVDSDNLLTGQKTVALQFVPKAKPAETPMENGALRMPAGPAGGIDGITDSMAEVAGKLNQIPFAQIGDNLNKLLMHADQTVGGEDMKRSIHSLAITLEHTQALVAKADKELTPALEKLPQMSADLQAAIAHANGAMSSLDRSSNFQRNAQRTMNQVGDAARSIQLLTDFLIRHPEALIRGRDRE